ncbi:MAG TPA: DUF1015 domain-containing protein [Clostridia bacterium]|nr:DUF1015 domain-containing protein [Clostridia bacterium]
MELCKQALAEVGVSLPNILLPAYGIDLHRFSVIACDQFTAQPDYWQAVEDIVDDACSTLRITLPEVYLSNNNDAAIDGINRTMRRYLDKRLLESIGETFVYLRRRTSTGVRQGLVVALDLEQYDYAKDAKSMIRATEGTIVERLPPRIKIRSGAPLETPHIMVLIDDRQNRLMTLLADQADALECLYDFTLMKGGGHSTGYRVDSPTLIMEIAHILKGLKSQGDNFLFAMGDGNHSFAAAKACWEALKPTLSPEACENHPARYALAELVNLYDPALKFESIHRLLYHVDPAAVQRELGFDAANPPDAQVLQPKLDEWLKGHPEAELEYVHGEQECRALGDKPDRLAIVFPPFDRDSLFEVVRKNGAFVRKSFSMGEARDKRYYLECRKIK